MCARGDEDFSFSPACGTGAAVGPGPLRPYNLLEGGRAGGAGYVDVASNGGSEPELMLLLCGEKSLHGGGDSYRRAVPADDLGISC